MGCSIVNTNDTSPRATVVAMAYRWAPLGKVKQYEEAAADLGVSVVARGPRGFLRQYKAAGGDWRKLTPYWQDRRNGFVARHLAQARAAGEKLYVRGEGYSRRGLALLMWAYDPARGG
jgi:hypothetical protein